MLSVRFQIILSLSTKDITEWSSLLHNPQMRTTVKTNCHYGGEYLRYIVDSNNRVESLHEISSVEVTLFDQWDDPCAPAADGADFNQCVQDYIDSHLNCALPWRSHHGSLSLPLCSGINKNRTEQGRGRSTSSSTCPRRSSSRTRRRSSS